MIDQNMLHLCADCDNEDCELRFVANENVVDCDDYFVLEDDEDFDMDEDMDLQEDLDFGDDE